MEEVQEKAWKDQAAREDDSFNRGKTQGIKEGRTQGTEEGKIQGIKEAGQLPIFRTEILAFLSYSDSIIR